MTTRRRLLLGGAGLLVAAGATAVEQPRVGRGLRRLALGDPEPAHPVPRTQGAVVRDSFASAAMNGSTRYVIAYPHGIQAGLPVLLVLTDGVIPLRTSSTAIGLAPS